MKNKQIIKMISKMADQVITFYFENNVKNFQMKIDKNPTSNEYTIYSYGILNIKLEDLERLKKTTEIHHDVEYDQYWELMGEGDAFEELILMARICENIKVYYEDNILEIILTKIFD